MNVFSTSEPGVHDMGKLQAFINTIKDDDEQYHSMMLIYNLQALNAYVNDYAAAIGLHLHIDGLRKQVQNVNIRGTIEFTKNMHALDLWNQMAGREACMTVFHFGKSLNAIRSTMKDTPTIRAITKHDLLREANRDLETNFPNYNDARHAAGHRAEAISSLDAVKKHAVDHGHMKEYLPGRIVEDTYVTTFEGRRIEVELTERKRKALSVITDKIYSAFPDLHNNLPPMS